MTQMCEVRVTGGTLPQEEINAYIDRAREKYRREPRAIDIAVDLFKINVIAIIRNAVTETG